MLILSLIVAIPIIIGVLWTLDESGVPWYNNLLPTFIGGAILASIIWAGIAMSSYNTYLTDRAFFTTTNRQYKDAIVVYSDRVALNYKMMQSVFTDFTGKMYAKEVSSTIKQFRNALIRYNTSIVTKRAMHKNWFFKGLIVQPDYDMKVIELTLK